MYLDYIFRRALVMLLVIFLAVTINFMIPRLMPGDPVETQLMQLLSQGGGAVGDIRAMVESHRARFGLDQPIWAQYLAYWGSVLSLDLGVSLANYPERVVDAILGALPWTLGLLGAATLASFVAGTLLGGLMAWPRAGRGWQAAGSGMLLLSSIPYFLIGMVLLYAFAIVWPVLPAGGGLPFGMTPAWDAATLRGIALHAVLPLASIVLAETGAWAIGMRGMMVSVLGEDHITLAEAKGLRERRIFLRYGLRTAMLPQLTRLALALGHIVSGAILVEVIFSYPGIGFRLFQAVQAKDYFVIQGIVLMLTVSLALATFLLDLIYPLIDPRITLRRRG
ncbi:MAG: ABC transporter permease [Rhodobacteraceae bacterium]|jgi:peptide/nickel transport system permease protein|nr:ABC transporter permease [Paracoccaceae bacterium]